MGNPVDDITQSLKDNVQNNALSLAADFFPGPVQTALTDYLNGMTLKLGDIGSLTVQPAAQSATLEMSPVTVTGSPTQATVTVSGTGNLAGASIAATFTKSGDQVSLDLAALMGGSWQWKISDLWPALLSGYPFNELAFANGKLDLNTRVQPTLQIDFMGSGDLQFNGEDLVNAALRVIYEKPAEGSEEQSGLGVLFGVVVTNFSLGDLWSDLKGISFKDTGFIFSSINQDQSSLGDLGLISDQDVPALKNFKPVQADFQVQAGVTAFTSMTLASGSVAVLKDIVGDVVFNLYANVHYQDKELTIIANALGWQKSKFTFDGLDLDWDIKSSGTNISLSSGGQYQITANQPPLSFSAQGTLQSDASFVLSLSIENWADPFGYQKLIVKDFAIDIAAGAGSDGVTLGLSGDFQFTPDDGDTFEFAIAGAITDFEIPTGLAFLLKEDSPGQLLSLGDMIDGITSVDVNKIPAIAIINEIIEIKNILFWAVETDGVEIDGKSYTKGFGLQADFVLFEKFEEKLAVEIDETSDPPAFSGSAEMEEPILLPASSGGLLTICRYDDTTEQADDTKGPLIFVASQPKTIGSIQGAYFYTSVYMKFLDVISEEIYGVAADQDGDYVFEFIYGVSIGDKHGSSGAWAGDQVKVWLNTKAIAFGASFSFDFGWKTQPIGPLKVFGIELIPQFTLPGFEIGADCLIGADLTAGTFKLGGGLTFDFLSIHFNPSFNVALDLSAAPAELSAIAGEIWDWFESHIEHLLESIWSDIKDFAAWVKQNLELFAKKAKEVIQAAWNGFKSAFNDVKEDFAKAFAPFLKDIGYLASEIYDGFVNGIQVAADEVEKIVDDVFNQAKQCAVQTAGALGVN